MEAPTRALEHTSRDEASRDGTGCEATARLLLDGETARVVPGFERYRATDLGRVVSLVGAPRVLRPFSHAGGHLHVKLWPVRDTGDGPVQPRLARVDVLVLQAFVGTRQLTGPDACEAVHLNGDLQDNRLANVRYVPRAQHRWRTRKRKLDPAAVRELRDQAAVYQALPAAARAFYVCGISMRSALAAISGQTWRSVPAEPLEIRPDLTPSR